VSTIEGPDELQGQLAEFIAREFMPGEDPALLTPTTGLLSEGILNSIGLIKLVTFLEDRFDVRFEAHEMSAESIGTIQDLAARIREKRKGA